MCWIEANLLNVIDSYLINILLFRLQKSENFKFYSEYPKENTLAENISLL